MKLPAFFKKAITLEITLPDNASEESIQKVIDTLNDNKVAYQLKSVLRKGHTLTIKGYNKELLFHLQATFEVNTKQFQRHIKLKEKAHQD